MRKMKDSGVEWIDTIPENWKVVPMKALFSFGKGLPITKDNLTEAGIPVISYGQIHARWNVGIDKTTASRREYKFSTWCGVFNAAAFHVEKLYRLMPVPWHSAADVAIQRGS